MRDNPSCAHVGALAAQVLLGSAALAFIAFAPPAEGMLLLVPVAPSQPEAVAAAALENGGHIIELGPISGSVVVWGRSKTLLLPLLSEGVLVLAGSPKACGSTQD